jgi:hypothetical protein
MFDSKKGNYLNLKDLSDDERYRKVLLKNNTVIDLATGELIYGLKAENDSVCGPIYKNYMYCNKLIKLKDNMISDNDMICASNKYINFLEKQELIKSRKLILFPQQRIF